MAMARERRLVFGEVAELYDRARPSYPPELIDDVIEAARLSPADRALEVGTGTGKATELFAERGVGVLGLEPDPEMAGMARRRCAAYEEVTIEQSAPGHRSARARHRLASRDRHGGWLGEAETSVYRWTKTYSTEEYVALLSTHSDHLILPASGRGEILEAIAEVIDSAGGGFSMTSRHCCAWRGNVSTHREHERQGGGRR
jgi:hypothetical protein